MRKRILFVDSNTQVLKQLENRLVFLVDQWDMLFVSTGEEALSLLEKGQFDAIVSDMNLPGIGGVMLLARVQETYPAMVRIALSEDVGQRNALQAQKMSYQFVNKTCEVTTLREVIDRACALQTLLNKDMLRKAVGKVEQLPTRPTVYHELTRTLAKADVSMQDVAKIVEQDVGLYAKLLQTVNSAFFGLRKRITSVVGAVTYLGTEMIKNLVLSLEVFSSFDSIKIEGFSLDALQDHSLHSATIARNLLDNQGEETFTAALLHDVGKLVLACHFSDYFSRIVTTMQAEGRPMHEVELKLTGVTHAEIGAYLLGLWGLPYDIVEAVAFHHAPWKVEQAQFDMLSAVYIANALEHEQTDNITLINEGYLEEMHVADQLTRWREMVGMEKT